MDDVDTSVYYDDENDFIGFGYHHGQEYDYEYEDAEGETLSELYEYCLTPTFYDTGFYILPLFLAMFIFRLISQMQSISDKLFHGLSMVIGICIIQHYAEECLFLLVLFVILSYITLNLPKKYYKEIAVFLPSLFIIIHCEFYMKPIIWHKVRSIIMTMAMRTISVAADSIESNDIPDFYSYMGYMFCAATSYLGPWVPLKDYLALRRPNQQGKWWLLIVIGFTSCSFLFLSMSNCWIQWMLPDDSWMWLLAYRDALSFRTSHYFISYLASAISFLGGYPFSLISIVKPLEIELPRSLVQVVVYWNMPMHFWLKKYIFRPSLKYLGKFGAVIITYLMSSFLHGFNFQLGAVLLSLGLYTYVEHQLRIMFANIFDACIASKECAQNKCTHLYNPYNSWWVIAINIMFTVLTIFHLAYLGLMFDTSELQETGYSYIHTIKKWSELGFASHWVALATYCIYFLIR
ncbi:PREDICTED: protein-serine O-palmitoleoyltransferase porcupine [Polistes canadensis]|uniref:protein-serine O-palmitoleoyltransferase porcupine n=1 Tax=Polistes canadensis TaxID=91411 RepID=UPI000718FFF7|nr:PREDICTED: protein-serine O-palmitoleoyltransferase porcupine [Polistes canadensis]